MPPVLVTGAAGFLGFHVARRLLAQGQRVDGVDALVGAADPALQALRWNTLQQHAGFRAYQLDLTDADGLQALIAARRPQRVVHLAARVGVRESVREPQPYLESNLAGFLNLLEALKHHRPAHLVYASSSSVYGDAGEGPAREDAAADAPVSFYAATKRANELMAHSWAAVHGVACTGLRFFTVYGPWGRPEMAVYRFVRAIESGEEITLYDGGRMRRDFTYVDDAVDALLAVLEQTPVAAPLASVLNVGGGQPVRVLDLVRAIESLTGRQAKLRLAPGPAGDVPHTEADPSALRARVGVVPTTSLRAGLQEFVSWYRELHGSGELTRPLRSPHRTTGSQSRHQSPGS